MNDHKAYLIESIRDIEGRLDVDPIPSEYISTSEEMYEYLHYLERSADVKRHGDPSWT